MAGATNSHEARFQKWQRLVPRSTRFLSSFVLSEFSSPLERHGFERVGHRLRRPEESVSGREIEFERWSASLVDSVAFNFDKYGAPRLQIHLSRRASEPPHEWIRSANLVSRRGQYLTFWGKPWWFPDAAWSEQASRRVVHRLEALLPDGLAFLADGTRSAHISRRTT